MRSIFPWRLIRKGTPINKPGHQWFNAVTNALMGLRVVYSGDEQPFIDRPNSDGTNWKIKIPNPVLVRRPFPFQLSFASDGSAVRVRLGTWTRYDSEVTFTPDGGEVYKSVTALDDSSPFGASQTYVVYVALEDSTDMNDPALIPNSIGVYVGATLPTDASPKGANIYRQIGTASTDSGSDINGVVQTWWGGDIDDTAIVPDANSNYDGAGDRRTKSIELSDRTDRHALNLQIYGWDTASTTSIADSDLIPFQDVSDDNLPVKYISKEDLLDDVPSTTTTVVTDIQYDSTTHQLQKKTQLVTIQATGTESGWTVITGGQAVECTP